MAIKKLNLKYQFNDKFLNIVLQDYRDKINYIIDQVSESGDVDNALEDYVPITRTISTNTPLSGGGSLSGNLSLSLTGLSWVGTANYLVGVQDVASDGWEYKSLLGTTNQITVTHAAVDAGNVSYGTITLATPQDIATTSNVQFGTIASADITVDSKLVLSAGSITDGDGAISFGNENLSTTGTLNISSDLLSVGDVANRVGIGTPNPDGTLHVFVSSAGNVTAHASMDDFVIEVSGDGGMSILQGNTSQGFYAFGDVDDNYAAGMDFDHQTKIMRFFVENTPAVYFDGSGNVGIGTSTFGTNASKNFASLTGVAPTTSPANCFQMYSADVGGAAGKAGVHFRDEAGNVTSIGDGKILDSSGAISFGDENLITTGTLGCSVFTMTENSDTIVLTHDGTNAHMKWSDGILFLKTDEGTNNNTNIYLQGKGTGKGQLQVYNADNSIYTLYGSTGQSCHTGVYNLQFSVAQNIRFWAGITSGNPYHYIYGWHVTDADWMRMRVEADGDALIEAENNLNILAIGGNISFGDENLSTTGFLTLDKTSGKGIKVDVGTPTFGWRDLLGDVFARNTGANKPTFTTYRDSLLDYQFAVGDEEYFKFHIPHDYVEGTDIHLHVHWSHVSAAVTGGTVTFEYEISYAKGHGQAIFGASVGTTFNGTAATGAGGQYKHIITEVQISAGTPDGNQIDSDDLEPDGVIIARFDLNANNMTGATPDPFIHFVDIHYQSTNIGTKNKINDFYA